MRNSRPSFKRRLMVVTSGPCSWWSRAVLRSSYREVQVQIPVRRKDGRIFTTAARITAVEVDGSPHWLCVQRDVTEEKRAEAALRESEERLRISQKAGGIGSFELFPATGRIITSEQDPRQKRLIKIPLEGFPKRPNKTTRIRIAVGFSGENTMVLKIVDRGFGELFPMSGIEIRQEVRL